MARPGIARVHEVPGCPLEPTEALAGYASGSTAEFAAIWRKP